MKILNLEKIKNPLYNKLKNNLILDLRKPKNKIQNFRYLNNEGNKSRLFESARNAKSVDTSVLSKITVSTKSENKSRNIIPIDANKIQKVNLIKYFNILLEILA